MISGNQRNILWYIIEGQFMYTSLFSMKLQRKITVYNQLHLIITGASTAVWKEANFIYRQPRFQVFPDGLAV